MIRAAAEPFTRSAGVWADLFGGDCKRRAEAILPLLGRPDGLLFDWGCGPGGYTKEFAASGWAAIGIDSEWSMVKQAVASGVDARPGCAAESPMIDSGGYAKQLGRGSERHGMRYGKLAAAQTCIGAFSVIAAEQPPLRVLRNFRQSMRRGGVLVFDFLGFVELPAEKRFVAQNGRHKIACTRTRKPSARRGLIDTELHFCIEPPIDEHLGGEWVERFCERNFRVSEIAGMLGESGFSDSSFQSWDKGPAGDGQPGIVAVARKVGSG